MKLQRNNLNNNFSIIVVTQLCYCSEPRQKTEQTLGVGTPAVQLEPNDQYYNHRLNHFTLNLLMNK